MPRDQRYDGAATDWDAAMQDALHRESVETLRYQLELERGAKVRMEKNDFFFALGVMGFSFGLGYAVGGLKPKLSGSKSKLPRRRR